MNVRIISALFFVLLGWTACSSPTPAPDVPLAVDTAAEVRHDVSEPPGGLECCPSGVCSLGEQCFQGACHATPGSLGCLNKGHCLSGQVCEGATLCACEDPSCEPSNGACTYPEGCCNAPSDCGEGDVCLNGTCQANPTSGRCFADSDCGDGLVCKDAAPCTCGDSDCQSTSGLCVVPGPCCGGDEECGASGQCQAEGCEATPEAGRCFDASSCASGEVCAGVSLCDCGVGGCLVPTTNGACIAEGEACCVSNGECGKGELCVDGLQCLKAPETNSCYLDAHCGKGRLCVGATVCPCGDDACETAAGTCHTPLLPCADDSACVVGMRCVVPDALQCPMSGDSAQGVCVEDVASGCWVAGDCGKSKRCLSETLCLDPAGCSEANSPGTCQALANKDVCCSSHLDCADGLQCRNSNTYETCPPSSTAVCLPEPEYGINCWNYMDCPEAMVCLKARICACGARCHKSGRGFCQPASAQVCNSNLDCGDSYSCARELECIVNPCNATDDCPLGGKCQADMPGSCWNHSTCGDGSYCKGLRICPADAVCNDIDKPGVCATKETEGACCESYFACDGGLRCISAVSKTQCTLDISSICVPYGVFNASCFTDDDCAENRKCTGQTTCPCGTEGCDEAPSAGQCVLK